MCFLGRPYGPKIRGRRTKTDFKDQAKKVRTGQYLRLCILQKGTDFKDWALMTVLTRVKQILEVDFIPVHCHLSSMPLR